MHDAVALWAKLDGCTGTLQSSAAAGPLDLDASVSGAETVRESYGGCPAGIDVGLWTLKGSGHTPDLTDAFAPAVLDWFAAHPRR